MDIHHIYSGRFPYKTGRKTLHATENGLHFTQSAGLIAAHPILYSICDDIPAFSWVMRFRSWQKFGYDPDTVFSNDIDIYGFDIERKIKPNIISKYDANS